jgi:hypothetical protein
MAAENSYFENVIQIAVFEGRKKLFSKDFQKRHFADLIPASFLEGSILSNMTFGRVATKECHFQATICEPEGARSYVVDIAAGTDGKYTTQLIDY